MTEHAPLAAAVAPDGDVPPVYACYRFPAKLRAYDDLLQAHPRRIPLRTMGASVLHVARTTIESADGASRLAIHVDPVHSGYDSEWTVALATPDLTATHGFWSGVEPIRLADYFRELAGEWTGWKGDKVFASVEHDLSLRATHDSLGHVRLWVRLGTQVAEESKTWLVSAPLSLEAGRLDQLAARVRRELTES